jgi:hypothetical protein
MTKRPDKAVMSILRLPGVGTLKVSWNSYGNRYAPHVTIRFGPSRKIRAQIRAANKAEYLDWLQRNVMTS